MIEEVDEDGDGNINIVEFLTMMKSKVHNIVQKESMITNEGPVRIRYKYLVPIYVFLEMKLRDL
jgi:hypothetical protein